MTRLLLLTLSPKFLASEVRLPCFYLIPALTFSARSF